jgi:enamine deaminase RidA (YjgF/YER057c/UK114 family)
MKKSILIFFIIGSLSSFAQNPVIQYSHTSRQAGSSDAVIVKDVPLAHTSQIFSLDKRGEIIFKDNLNKQINQIFVNLSKVLKIAESDIGQIVKLKILISLPRSKQRSAGDSTKENCQPSVM